MHKLEKIVPLLLQYFPNDIVNIKNGFDNEKVFIIANQPYNFNNFNILAKNINYNLQQRFWCCERDEKSTTAKRIEYN